MSYLDNQEDPFIGSIHPKHPHIKVIGWDGTRNKQRAKMYIIHCERCSPDIELFPNRFLLSKGSVLGGIAPCGCAPAPRWNEAQFIIRIKRSCLEKQGIRFIKWNGEFRGSLTKVVMCCEKHGEWDTANASSIISVGVGCPKCFHLAFAEKRRTPESVANNKLEQIGSISIPSYINISNNGWYKNSSSIATLLCSKCKTEWNNSYNNLVSQHNKCPNCAKCGFKSDKPAIIYINYSKCGIIKIGISNNDPKKRLTRQIKSSGINFINIKNYYRDSGLVIEKVEESALNHFRMLYKSPNEKWDGYTEMFIDADLKYILNYVEMLLRKYDNYE